MQSEQGAARKGIYAASARTGRARAVPCVSVEWRMHVRATGSHGAGLWKGARSRHGCERAASGQVRSEACVWRVCSGVA